MSLIHTMNDALYELELKTVQAFQQMNYPAVLMVAPPRSGTTLLYQLLTLKYDFFYPTNLLAKCYNYPYVFSQSIDDLNLDSVRQSSHFTSHLGNTHDFLEPHEWGWFWERFLLKNDQSLYHELSALQSLYPKPMIFKTIYFNYHVEKLVTFLPKAIFLRVYRNAIETIYSIYNAIQTKQQPIGSKEHYTAYVRYMNDPLRLAVLEYCYDMKVLDATLQNKTVLTVSYDDVVENTDTVLNEVKQSLYKQTGINLDERVAHYQTFKKQTHVSQLFANQIQAILNEYDNMTLIDLERELFGL